MIFEFWYYRATLPNSGEVKPRPVLIFGDDKENNLRIVDVHYCLVSSSSQKGAFDIEIDDQKSKELGLTRASIIKTTKMYTGSRRLLERKICDLPQDIKTTFIENYKRYQQSLMAHMGENNKHDSVCYKVR